MDRWKRFMEWCQRPSMIKTRSFNPRNIVVLISFSMIFASSIIFGAWRYQVATIPPYTFITSEDMKPLVITTNTTLTKDYIGNIVIGADGITLDGDGHLIIGPGLDNVDIYGPILDPDDVRAHTFYPNSTVNWGVTIGILLEGRTGVIIKNCYVSGFYVGFELYESDGNVLQGNTVANTLNGFWLEASSNNILLNNTANSYSDVDSHGFGLSFSCGNTLQDNTAKGYNRGLYINEWCDGNIFFHNALINNTVQVIAFYGPANETNTWDDGYPSGGNYWSDYTGVDANGDGIGDTPYVISENDIDRFPLMAPINLFDSGIEGGENNEE